MGTQKQTKQSKGPSEEERRQIYRSQEERRICEDIERGRWAQDSYLKGWNQYTAESFSSSPFEKQEFLTDFDGIDEE